MRWMHNRQRPGTNSRLLNVQVRMRAHAWLYGRVLIPFDLGRGKQVIQICKNADLHERLRQDAG
jgi:hypothetical protein